MNLTGNLKEQVENAETKEEARKLIANAGMELNDQEMDMVAGGEIFFRWNPLNNLFPQKEHPPVPNKDNS